MTLSERLYNLKRNDLAGAVALYKEGARAPDQVNWLMRLQSDTSRLEAAIAQISRQDWDENQLREDEWNEEDHPRDPDGKFGSGGGGPGDARRTNPGRPAHQRVNPRWGAHTQRINGLVDDIDMLYESYNKAADIALELEKAGNQAEANKHWEIAEKGEAAYRQAKQDLVKAEIAKARGDDPPNPARDREANAKVRKEYFATVADPENIAALASRKIVEVAPLGGGANISKKVTLDDGTTAVWKPAAGEDHGLRSNIPGGTYYLREGAASALAKVIGVEDLVPAVVAHHTDFPGHEDVPGTPADRYQQAPFHLEDHRGNTEVLNYGHRGSLHAWAPGTALVDVPRGVKFDREASEQMRVFDYIVGNTDRHAGNVLVHERDGKQMPVLIDNGLAFPSGPMDQFIQPSASLHQGRLRESTRTLIAGIDKHKVAEVLHKSKIDREAAKYTVIRLLRLEREQTLLESEGDETQMHRQLMNLSNDGGAEKRYAADAEHIITRWYGDEKAA